MGTSVHVWIGVYRVYSVSWGPCYSLERLDVVSDFGFERMTTHVGVMRLETDIRCVLCAMEDAISWLDSLCRLFHSLHPEGPGLGILSARVSSHPLCRLPAARKRGL